MLVGWAGGIVLGFVRIRILHGHVAVPIVVLGTTAEGERAAGRRQRRHRVRSRRRGGRGKLFLLGGLLGHAGVPLDLLRGRDGVGIVPRRAVRVGFGVGGPLLLHDGDCGRVREGSRSVDEITTAGSAAQAFRIARRSVRGRLRQRGVTPTWTVLVWAGRGPGMSRRADVEKRACAGLDDAGDGPRRVGGVCAGSCRSVESVAVGSALAG